MIRYDESSSSLILSVQDLLCEPFQTGHTGPAPLALRGQIGSAIHAKERSSQRNSETLAEVPLALVLTRRGLQVRIEGRADLVRPAPSGRRWIVEEIKSLLPQPAPPSEWTLDPSHAEQACFYGLLLHKAGKTVVQCTVRYIEAGTGRSRLFDAGFESLQTERLLLERLDRVIELVREQAAQRKQRQGLARALPFPHREPREPQRRLMAEVEAACQGHRPMLCSAPTGTGKTAGVLYPLLKRTLETDGQLFFLTSRVSQQELALQTLTAMLPPGGPALAVQIASKERSCPFEHWLCLEDRCPHLEQFRFRLTGSGLIASLRRAGVLSGAQITRESLAAGLCPFETTLCLVREATVVVADYNYIFHPTVALRLPPAGDRPLYLIVDEAHGLPTRVAEERSPRLDIPHLDDLATTCLGAQSPPLREVGLLLAQITRHHRETWKTLEEENAGRRCVEAELDRGFFERVGLTLETLMPDCFLALSRIGPLGPAKPSDRSTPSARRLDPLLDALFRLRIFCACAAEPPDDFATLWEPNALRLLCLNPAAFIRSAIEAFSFSLFMSATLTPFAFSARLLGVEESASVTLELPSPFPRENRLLLIVPTVETAFRARERDAAAIADLIRRAMALRAGNYLAFFPSFAFRDMVLSHFSPEERHRVLFQTPAMATGPILRRLRENTSGTLLLAAVQGGVFAEGVDYPGPLAIGAFIVGPGLPQVSPEQKLIEAYYERTDGKGKGFELASVVPGIIRAVQAAGRVIRTETDIGFIMLIGRRFNHKLYRSKLPPFWEPELTVVDDPIPPLAAFWNAVDARRSSR